MTIDKAAEIPTCRVETAVHSDGRIEQTVDWFGHVQKFIVDTREEGIKKALIELGWTPPSECRKRIGLGGE